MKHLIEIDEQRGRWSSKEQKLFLEGLRLYNRNWKLIAEYIKTRNGTQVRSHAQKYFIKEDARQVKLHLPRPFIDKKTLKCKQMKVDVSTQYGEDMIFISILDN